MGSRAWAKWALVAGMSASALGCGSDGKGGAADGGAQGQGDGGGQSGGSACNALCTGGGFDSGEEQVFAGGTVIECLCAGGNASLELFDCQSYCESFNVEAELATLSMTTVPNDKCVCDGTQKPGGGGSNDGGVDDGQDASAAPSWDIGDDGLPVVPDDALASGNGRAYVVVTNSTTPRLPNGFYEAGYNTSSSAQFSVSFAETSDSAPTLWFNINGYAREMADKSFECAMASDLIVRYGTMPGFDDQLLAKSCSIEWTYDAENDAYAGTARAVLAEDPTNDASPSAEVAASFVWKESAGGT